MGTSVINRPMSPPSLEQNSPNICVTMFYGLLSRFTLRPIYLGCSVNLATLRKIAQVINQLFCINLAVLIFTTLLVDIQIPNWKSAQLFNTSPLYCFTRKKNHFYIQWYFMILLLHIYSGVGCQHPLDKKF